ncbi:hypothetical protein Pve01_37290 [Planomonospora venezuelensis]|uniref:Uncharacterized protein n=1 Tax=Planomonospora venezuelensis TaxID=1999 RepID=A0A841CYU9_PLAVE|nr:hypothetical protein [Planomonospora venezuelensis]GIN02071.1 hypothetical protein Pve01_37290 [Planomonospora venezuelensis]
MTPTLLSHLTRLNTAATAGPTVGSEVRSTPDPFPGRRDTPDGARWPYPRDAAAEPTGLIAADRRPAARA